MAVVNSELRVHGIEDSQVLNSSIINAEDKQYKRTNDRNRRPSH
ncbi:MULTISPECIES: hypothetical protein [Nostocales]|uniref:Transposase n=2 Tax=Nostocales TaxID=1161 RepID=A0ABW8WU18_9CYAN|nr:hypothetical protein [Tolypothrix bouteillei]